MEPILTMLIICIAAYFLGPALFAIYVVIAALIEGAKEAKNEAWRKKKRQDLIDEIQWRDDNPNWWKQDFE